jgi:hypothetical protein
MCSTESHSLVRSLETQCLVEDKYPWESIRLGGPATPRLKDSGTSGCACYHQSTREEPSVRRMCWNPTCASSRCQTSRVNTQEASRWLVVSSSWSHRAHSAFCWSLWLFRRSAVHRRPCSASQKKNFTRWELQLSVGVWQWNVSMNNHVLMINSSIMGK